MKFSKIFTLALCGVSAMSIQAEKLTGTVIGTELSVDYTTGQQSTTVNTAANAFDGDLSTFFASYDRYYTWVGLDLGEKYVINKVGFSPRNDGVGPNRTVLAMFEGANNPDFSDALPFYINTATGVIGEMTYADVNCSRGFRYVRYVGPHDARCNIAEVEFYGEKGEGDDSNLYQLTNLPLVVINIKDAEDVIEKEKNLECHVSIIDNHQISNNVDYTLAEVRGRGNASWQFEKKPYRIKFDKKQNVLDAPAKAKKWTLINNYGDKTLMRNLIAFEISRRVGLSYTPYAQPVDVVMNGEYKGCYQLCDQIEVNDNRVAITEMEPEDVELPALSGGYLVEVDAYADQEVAGTWFTSKNGNPVTVKSPDLEDDFQQAQYDYISNYFNQLEDALFASNFTDAENGYRKYLDLTSFLRHFIVGELSGNTDTYWSMYMSKDRDSDKFFVGPVWDFDIAFDNDNRTYPIHNLNNYVYASGRASFAGNMKRFIDRIIVDDTTVKDELKKIWSDARHNSNLSYDSLKEYINDMEEYLNESQQLNFTRWKIMNQWVHQNPQIAGSYAGEVSVVRSYLSRRFNFLDTKIGLEEDDYVSKIETSSSIYTSGSEIVIKCADSNYSIHNISGVCLATGTIDGEIRVSLPKGIYIVSVGNGVAKVVL